MTLENVQVFSEAAGDCNEDAFVVKPAFAVVIDGATGLNKVHLSPALTDAAWMARRLAELLEEHLQNTGKSVEEILTICARVLKDELDSMGYNAYPRSYPSACVSIVRVNGARLECFFLGDCPILLRARGDDSIKLLYDDSVPARDEKVVEWICKESSKRGISVAEASKYALDLLKKNRYEMNTLGAYWIFEPTGAGIPHMNHFICAAKEYSSAAIMSDGFFDAVHLYRIVNSFPDLFSQLKAGSAEKICQKIRKLQMDDDALNRYPRLKASDDATAVYAEIMDAL